MTDYAEMAKLAKRIEFLEAREVLSGADSWLKLEERLTEVGARLGAVQNHFLDFRSGVNRDLDNAIERIADLETLHYKGKYPEAHNYPEPVHNEPTLKEWEE